MSLISFYQANGSYSSRAGRSGMHDTEKCGTYLFSVPVGESVVDLLRRHSSYSMYPVTAGSIAQWRFLLATYVSTVIIFSGLPCPHRSGKMWMIFHTEMCRNSVPFRTTLLVHA